MKYVLKNIFAILIFSFISFAQAQEITINNELSDISLNNQIKNTTSYDTNDKSPFILNCKKDKNSANCSKTSINTEKMINENDILFLGQRLYMDNYNPLYFNQYPEYLNSAVYTEPVKY